jgi:ABC-type phosphate/phosphonate transport system permease subunit
MKIGPLRTKRRKGTAGALLRLIVFLVVYCLLVIIILPARWWIGAKFIRPVIGDYAPTPQEAEILNTMDNTLYTLIWGLYFAILLAIAIEIFRETTEGRVYVSR